MASFCIHQVHYIHGFFFLNENYQTWNFQSFSDLAYLLLLLGLKLAKETQKFTAMKSDKQNLIIVIDSYLFILVF